MFEYKSLVLILIFACSEISIDAHISISQKEAKQEMNDWLIDLSFTPYQQYLSHVTAATIVKCDQFWDFEVSLAALSSLLFIQVQWNGLLCVKGVVILDSGHHLTTSEKWMKFTIWLKSDLYFSYRIEDLNFITPMAGVLMLGVAI